LISNIFKFFLSRGNIVEDTKRLAYANWFLDTIPSKYFNNSEERLLAKCITYSIKLGIPITLNYIQAYMVTSLKKIMIEEKIYPEGVGIIDYTDPIQIETAYEIFKSNIATEYEILYSLPDFSIDNFYPEILVYMNDSVTKCIQKIIEKSFSIIESGKGATDAGLVMQKEINTVMEVFSESNLEELPGYVNTFEGKDVELVCKTNIEDIDRDMHGVYKTRLYGLEAAPGIGKTRFALGVFAYNASVYYKKDVAYFQLEQSKKEVEAMLVARHIYELKGLIVPDDNIYRNDLDKEDVKLVEIAKYDLFESGKYGKLYIRCKDLEVNSFINKFITIDNLHGPFDLFILDYAYIVEHVPGPYERAMDQETIIKLVYRRFKRFCRNYFKAGVIVNQLNKNGIEKTQKDIITDTGDAAGGQEVYRNTDFNLVLGCTEEMEAQHIRRLGNPKKRYTEGMGRPLLKTRLGACVFVAYKEVKI